MYRSGYLSARSLVFSTGGPGVNAWCKPAFFSPFCYTSKHYSGPPPFSNSLILSLPSISNSYQPITQNNQLSRFAMFLHKQNQSITILTWHLTSIIQCCRWNIASNGGITSKFNPVYSTVVGELKITLLEAHPFTIFCPCIAYTYAFKETLVSCFTVWSINQMASSVFISRCQSLIE